MTRELILERVRNVLRERMDRSLEIQAETELLADLQLDSLERITLLVELENEFEVCLDFEEMPDEITQVNDLLSLLEKELQHASSRVSS